MLVQSSNVDLARRMARPQRHRLLHGYPMAPLLQPLDPREAPWRSLDLDPRRPLLIGVLPHTFCNPKVRGCGFCTFPHEKHSNDAARAVVARVALEVRGRATDLPGATRRRVPALYFGGGTANLTPPDAFAALADALVESFDLSSSEVSLEGVPRYFLTRDEALLDVLERMPVRHRRLSVGVQTFDPAWLARMGRLAFGTEETFAEVVRTAHARGMTVSCDLLFNLPGQAVEAAIDDVDRAAALGFDQICIYNLVLDPEIDAEWARSRSLLARVPAPEIGAERWLVLRERLFALGYVQTTLTNFERSDVVTTERRFVYERASFDAATYDALGFGPGAISTFTGRARRSALKWMNAGTSRGYSDAMDTHGRASDRRFLYGGTDLRVLHSTRALSALRIERASYRAFFGTDAVNDFTEAFAAAQDRGLVTVDASAVALTPRGMFYADAVAGLVASRRAAELRAENESLAHAMG